MSGQSGQPRVYPTVAAASRTLWFIIPYIWNLAINFGANYGLEYATLTQWGKDDMVHMTVWKLVRVPKSLTYTCIAMDVMVTGFLVAYFTCLLGPGSVVDGVKKHKLAPVAEEAISTGVWRFFPMRTKSICKRSFLLGVECAVTFGLVTVIIMSIVLGGDEWSGYDYCWFKACWAMALASVVYPISHFSAVSVGKFTPEELAEKKPLLDDGEDNNVTASAGQGSAV